MFEEKLHIDYTQAQVSIKKNMFKEQSFLRRCDRVVSGGALGGPSTGCSFGVYDLYCLPISQSFPGRTTRVSYSLPLWVRRSESAVWEHGSHAHLQEEL